MSLRGAALQQRPPPSDDDYGTIPQQPGMPVADGPIVAENYNSIPLPPGQTGMGSGMPPYMAESWFHTNQERFAGAALLENSGYTNGTFLFVPGEQQNTLVLLYKREGRVLARDINYVGGLFNDPLLQASPHALFRSLGEFIRAFNSAEQLRVLSAFIGPELAGVAMPSNPADFALEDFYHHVDGDGAVALLKRPNHQDGDYLFRASKSNNSDPQLCLSYREGTAVRHQRISWNTKRQLFEQHGSTNTFATLQALVKAVNHAATLTGRVQPLRNVITRS